MKAVQQPKNLTIEVEDSRSALKKFLTKKQQDQMKLKVFGLKTFRAYMKKMAEYLQN